MQMKLLFKVLAIGLLPSLCTAKEGTPTATSSNQQRPLVFMENKGQIVNQDHQPRPDIDFRLASEALTVFVGDGQLHYQFSRLDNEAEMLKHQQESAIDPQKRGEIVNGKYTMYRVDVELVGADKNAAIVTEGRQDYYEMYYNEFTPESGARSNGYSKLTYKNVYPNIDWVLYSKNGQLKYEFVIRAGGKASDIKLKFGGATALKITETGGLTIETPLGKINEAAPVSFDAEGKSIQTPFVLNGNILSFNTASYNGAMVIDPTITWGTYYGGTSSTDYGYATAVTPDGNHVYFCGYTSSTSNIGTSGSWQQFYTSLTEAMLVKFNGSGTLQWGTYYGGTGGTDVAYDIALDPSGNVYIGGRSNTTSGTAIATSGSHQQTNGGGDDAFVAKFNASGVRQWGTYTGGTSSDYGYAVAVDNAGNVALGGYYSSSNNNNVSTPFAQQPTIFSTPEGFVVKFNTNGTKLWGTFYGGENVDYVFGMDFDASGHLYFTGWTYSSVNIASSGSHQSSNANPGGAPEGYLVKLDGAQGTRLWGTFYGGTSTDYGQSVACGDSNMVFLAGFAYSNSGIASSNAYQSSIGSGTPDLFLAKFDSLGNREWGTYNGGNGADQMTTGGHYLAVDFNNNAYITCYTSSSSSGMADGGIYNSQQGSTDHAIAKFNTSGDRVWGSYIGGSSVDYGYGIAADNLGNIYLCGRAVSSNNMTTSGAYQTSPFSGTYDAYMMEIQDCALPAQPGTITGGTTVCQGSSQTYSIAAVTGATFYEWTLPNGWTGTSTTNSITVVPSATSGVIKVKACVACGKGLPRTLNVTALAEPGASITPSGPTTFCDGANVTLNANTGTGYTYVWKQGTTALGTTTNAHVVSTSGNYTVEITNSNNCTSISPAEVIVVHPNPNIVFPTLSPTCTNNPNINLGATPTGGTYTGAGISGTVLNPLNAGPGIHTIVYSYTDSNSCMSTSNQSITVNPAPTVTLPSFSTICSDVIVPLNMAIPPGGVYSGTGVSGSNFSPNISGIGTFNITYTYTDGNNCTAAQTEPITVNPMTATNFPSITPKCIDAAVVNLSATPLGGTFSGPGVNGTQFNPGTGAGNHIIHYDYTNQYGCTTHDSETIVVNALPVLNFPALDSVCNAGPVTMLATPTGGIYTGPGTGVGNQLNTTQAGLGMHTISYTYTDANTCTNSTQQTVLVQPAPVINSQPALYIEICEGEALGVNVGASNVGTYQWQQNSVNVAGAQSSLYVVGSADPTHTGNYQVIITGTGACATTQLISNSSAILVNPLPPVNLTPGSDTICNGDTIVLNSGLGTNFNYQWKLNGNNIAGATTATLPVATPGAYKVFVTNQNSGCNTNSSEVMIGVNPSPDATITYTGPTVFCDGDDLMINTEDTVTGTSFQWMNNGSNIGGATSADYSATATGVYSVVLTNSFNCSRTSTDVSVTVNPLPTPAVTVLDAWGNMTTGQYDYYQWNKDGSAINGANSQTYQATVAGSYTVTVRDSNGCENTSPPKLPLAISNVANGNSTFVLYPNPNTGTFVVEGTITSTDGKAAIEITDVTGKLVYREDVKTMSDKLNHTINISNVASGAYMIRIVSDNAREVVPFVKR